MGCMSLRPIWQKSLLRTLRLTNSTVSGKQRLPKWHVWEFETVEIQKNARKRNWFEILAKPAITITELHEELTCGKSLRTGSGNRSAKSAPFRKMYQT